VTYKDAVGLEHVVSIVGIDEVTSTRLHQLALASCNALMKASPGDRVDVRAPEKTDHIEIIHVEYAPVRWILSRAARRSVEA